ncbi:FIG01046273: hypothetical protein, partial [hydrothermal vent metagenome]
MQQKGQLPKIQHYVPKFLLRNFVKAGTQQVWVCDKQNDNVFFTNIKNVAAEKGFYNIEKDGGTHSLESPLSNLESSTSKLIKKIITDKSIKWLSPEDKTTIALFVSVQQLRTPHLRETFLHMGSEFQKLFDKMGINSDKVEGYRTVDEDGARFLSMKLLAEKATKLLPYFYEKPWLLLRTKRSNPFYISDNPISLQLSLQHKNDFGLHGNIGLAVKGIEIYLPLSSTLTLAMYCPSIVEEMQ